MLYSDLREIKAVLGIDPLNLNEDKVLLLYLEWASRWIDELLAIPASGIQYQQWTEICNGTGTTKLLLRHRPVFPYPGDPRQIQVFVDEGANYGTTTGAWTTPESQLTYGEGFSLMIDQPDGTSRSGILLRVNDLWPKPFARVRGLLSPFVVDDTGSIKVVYYGGYTLDSLPSNIRAACVHLVTALRWQLPLGFAHGDSYGGRSVTPIAHSMRDKLLTEVKPMLHMYRNWKW